MEPTINKKEELDMYQIEGQILDIQKELSNIEDYIWVCDKKYNSPHNYLENPIFEKMVENKLESYRDKESYIKNIKIKNSLIRSLSKTLTINRYLRFEEENEREICMNYIIRKFTNKRLNNKNIYIQYFTTNFTSMGHQEMDNTIMDTESYTLFNHSKNNNIYCWINHDGKKKYKSHIKNDENGNNYYLVNNDNHGDIMLGNNSEVFRRKNSKIKFDFYRVSFNVCYQELHCNIENNLILFILDFIITSANKGSQVLFSGRLTDNLINNFIKVISPYFKKTILLHPKYLHMTTDDVFVLFDDYRGSMDKYDIDNIKLLVSNKNITKMTLTKFKEDANAVFFKKVHSFLNKLSKKKIKKLSLYYKILPYLYDEKYSKIRDIIMYNIKKSQVLFANDKSNRKYLEY